MADLICQRLALGESLRQICKDPEMPAKITVLRWKNDNEAFRSQYARAREEQGDSYFEMGIEVAVACEDAAKARLAFDAYKWAAGKLKPGVYGDKLQHANAAGDGDVTIQVVKFSSKSKTE
jgi:hypothetical protein